MLSPKAANLLNLRAPGYIKPALTLLRVHKSLTGGKYCSCDEARGLSRHRIAVIMVCGSLSSALCKAVAMWIITSTPLISFPLREVAVHADNSVST